MEETRSLVYPLHQSESATSHGGGARSNFIGHVNHGSNVRGLKKRGHGSRSWIKIYQDGNSKTVTLDKATIMRYCSLPSRDLRLLDPMFIYPSTILGREKAIVVNLEQIRCVITADEVFLMNSLDGSVAQYKLELCDRLQKEKSDDLPFELRALELALELTCSSLDAQLHNTAGKKWHSYLDSCNVPPVAISILVDYCNRATVSIFATELTLLYQVNLWLHWVKELEMEIYPVLDELTSSISTLNLERVRRFKGHLLALTQRVQKVRDEIEHLMDDDGDMAEMCLTEKKRRLDTYPSSDLFLQTRLSGSGTVISKSAPASPERTLSGAEMLQRAFSSIGKYGSLAGSSDNEEKIEPLEMLLEAYFIVIDSTLNKLLSLKDYIDDTEDFINIKMGNIQNHLIQFELLLTAATLLATAFAAVTAVFGMNFKTKAFDQPSGFHWVLVVSGISCVLVYLSFLACFRSKKVLPA